MAKNQVKKKRAETLTKVQPKESITSAKKRQKSKEKHISAPKKGKHYTHDRTGYRNFVHELSRQIKSGEYAPIKGRGNFLKKASVIWGDIRGKEGIEDNYDVIIPQYLTGVTPVVPVKPGRKKAVPIPEGGPVVPGAEKPKKSARALKTETEKAARDLEQYIEIGGFIEFKWWESVADLDQLMSSPAWTNNCILRLVDDHGMVKELRDYNQYESSIYTAIKHDYHSGKLDDKADYPGFNFEGVSIARDGKYILVTYSMHNWDMVGMEETVKDFEKLKDTFDKKRREREAKRAAEMRGEKPEVPEAAPVVPGVPQAEPREISLARIEAERREKAFEFEMGQLREEFKDGIWDKTEYKAEKEEIRRRYGL